VKEKLLKRAEVVNKRNEPNGTFSLLDRPLYVRSGDRPGRSPPIMVRVSIKHLADVYV
jgi:hypothetical protein